LKRGRPVVLLVNEDFTIASSTAAKAYGIDNLPMVIFPNNMDNLSEDEILALTRRRFEEIVRKLTYAGNNSGLEGEQP
jgi:hypothetical protein